MSKGTKHLNWTPCWSHSGIKLFKILPLKKIRKRLTFNLALAKISLNHKTNLVAKSAHKGHLFLDLTKIHLFAGRKDPRTNFSMGEKVSGIIPSQKGQSRHNVGHPNDSSLVMYQPPTNIEHFSEKVQKWEYPTTRAGKVGACPTLMKIEKVGGIRRSAKKPTFHVFKTPFRGRPPRLSEILTKKFGQYT